MSLEKFNPEMVKACHSALDSGISRLEEFKENVLHQMGEIPCVAVHVKTLNENADTQSFKEKQSARKSLEDEIKKRPMCHYAVIKIESSNMHTLFEIVASDGHGGISPGGKFDILDEMPTGEDIMRRVIGFEIYECRQAVERKRRIDANHKALSEHKYAKGDVFKQPKLPGELSLYTKAEITSIAEDTGEVTLRLTKRGSRRRWTLYIDASQLESI